MYSIIATWLMLSLSVIRSGNATPPDTNPPSVSVCPANCKQVSCAQGYTPITDPCGCTICVPCTFLGLECDLLECPDNYYISTSFDGCSCPRCIPCKGVRCAALNCTFFEYEYQDPQQCCPVCQVCETLYRRCPNITCLNRQYLLRDPTGCHCPKCVPCLGEFLPYCPVPQCQVGQYEYNDPRRCDCPKCLSCIGRPLLCYEQECPANYFLQADPTGCTCPICVPCSTVACPAVKCGPGTYTYYDPNQCGCPVCLPCNTRKLFCPEQICPKYNYLQVDPTGCTCPQCVPCNVTQICLNSKCNASTYLYIDRYSCTTECLPCISKPLFCLEVERCQPNYYRQTDPTGCTCPKCVPCPNQKCPVTQ